MRPAKLLIACAWLAAALLAVEFGIRLAYRPGTQAVVYDELLGWRYRSGISAKLEGGKQLTTNQLGFRGAEPAKAGASSSYRILVLGDSYTAGMHVSDDALFTARLEKLLNQLSPAKPVEVINASVAAWATDQQLLYFESEGVKLAPQLVLLMAAPNDIRESRGKRFFYLGDDGRLVRNTSPLAFSLMDRASWWLLNHTATAQWLGFSDVFAMLKKHFEFSFPLGGREASDEDLFLVEEPREVREASQLFHELLKRLDSSVGAAQAKLVVSVMPTKAEYKWPFITSKKHAAGIVSARTEKFAGLAGIPFISLVKQMPELKGDSLRLFISDEYHLNQEGHEFVAKALAGDVLLRKLVGARP